MQQTTLLASALQDRERFNSSSSRRMSAISSWFFEEEMGRALVGSGSDQPAAPPKYLASAFAAAKGTVANGL